MSGAVFLSRVIDSLAWPVVVLVIVLLFRVPLATLIGRIKELKVPGISLETHDVVRLPTGNIIKSEPVPTARTEETRLSDEEIEASRKIAQARLDEDTKKVGISARPVISTPERQIRYFLDNEHNGSCWDYHEDLVGERR